MKRVTIDVVKDNELLEQCTANCTHMEKGIHFNQVRIVLTRPSYRKLSVLEDNYPGVKFTVMDGLYIYTVSVYSPNK